jgi:endothelin-converting enzyme
LTLGENLADNGGVSASLAAYHDLLALQPDHVLPGLEKLSPEALFFINFGRIWCSKKRPQSALQSVM